MGFDFKEFRELRNNFSKFESSFEKWLYQFLMREGLRFIREVKFRTPVDTGDLRNHWQLDSITLEGETLKCWFVNSMDYASFVEYGHAKPYKSGASAGSKDWVEGYFMMTVSIEIIEKKLPSRFNSEFIKFLETLGVT